MSTNTDETSCCTSDTAESKESIETMSLKQILLNFDFNTVDMTRTANIDAFHIVNAKLPVKNAHDSKIRIIRGTLAFSTSDKNPKERLVIALHTGIILEGTGVWLFCWRQQLVWVFKKYLDIYMMYKLVTQVVRHV
jgi:hypothetical protein